MKKVEAIVQLFRLDAVRQALEETGVAGLTVSYVQHQDRQQNRVDVYRGQETPSSFHPKARIEVVVGDRDIDEVITAILRAAHTGKIGDGRILILAVADAIRIRNGNRNEAAV